MRRQAVIFSKAIFSYAFLMLIALQTSFATPGMEEAKEEAKQSRFAILIAELITSPKKDDYKKLQALGDVYYVIQSPGYKVYLGSYGSYDAAQPDARMIQNDYGFKQVKIESLSDNTITNLLWRSESSPDNYDSFTAKGFSRLSSQKDLQTEIRVYEYLKGGWTTDKSVLKFNSNKTDIYNEKSRALNIDESRNQRIYVDVRYKDHRVSPMDLQIDASFGSETRNVVYNSKENYFEFNASKLNTFPLQFSYRMTSSRYGIQTDVSIPIRWVKDQLSNYNSLSAVDSYDTRGTNKWAKKAKFTPKGGPIEYSLLPSKSDEDEVEEYGNTRIKKKGTNAEEQIPSGYYVQIVALGRRPDLQKFADLSRYSDVLYTYEKSFYKVLVGGFDTKKDAESALRGIKKNYKKAYIIEVGNVSRDGGVRDDFIPKGYSFKGDSKKEEPKSYSYAAPRKQYIVKLAAYSDPDYFDDGEIKNMGTCWEIKKGRLTVKYITLNGLKTPYQANAALRDIRNAGFREAFLMTKDDKGRLVRVD